jgi:hypothetical protein
VREHVPEKEVKNFDHGMPPSTEQSLF